MTKHQASEQMVGYLYQIRYALQLLLEHENTNYQISIEKFDDVAFDANGTPMELIQLKHHVNRGGSLSDSSNDLWRTLKAWIDIINDKPDLLKNSDFFLITTSQAPSDSVAAILSKKDGDISVAYSKLKAIAENSVNQANKPFFDAFIKFGENRNKQLLKHIKVICSANDIIDTEKKIRKSIKYSCEPKNENYIFERLEGWWFSQSIKALCSDEPVYFTQNQVRNYIKTIRDEYGENNLPIDEDILRLDSFLEENLSVKQKIFIEQLRLLKLRSNQLNIALLDYYRAYEQRVRWVRNDLVCANDTMSYERKLFDAWQEAYEWMIDGLEELGCPDETSKVSAGKSLYKFLMSKDIRIRPYCDTPFVMKGSFHMLANDLKIGWHIDFKERLQHLLSPREKE